MKLYTEEQVNELCRALRDVAQWDEFLEEEWQDVGKRAMDSLKSFNKYIPIELPTDDEVLYSAQNHAKKMHKHDVMVTFREYSANDFKVGAKWMKEQILK